MGPSHSLLGHLLHLLQECPLCGLGIPSCYSGTLIAVGMSVDGFDPQADWLWGLGTCTAYGRCVEGLNSLIGIFPSELSCLL